MANNLILDFTHYYIRGEKRQSEPIAYQWDLGNVLIARIPATTDTITVRYWQTGQGESQTYIPNDVTTEGDVTTVTANMPNYYFEKANEVRVYITAMSVDQDVVTYEGYVPVKLIPKPDDYVDDHPEGGAIPYVEQAKIYAEDSEAWARGTTNGNPVDPDDPQYQNNSKYYSEAAGSAKTAAESAATNAAGSESSAAASAAAAAAIVTVANDGMVVIDDDDSGTEYAVTFKVENHHLVSTYTPAS